MRGNEKDKENASPSTVQPRSRTLQRLKERVISQRSLPSTSSSSSSSSPPPSTLNPMSFLGELKARAGGEKPKKKTMMFGGGDFLAALQNKKRDISG